MPHVTARTFYAKRARQLHPDLTPENDFQILALGSNKLENYSTAAKREWLKQEWADTFPVYGSVEAAENGIKKQLDEMIEPTGVSRERNLKYVLYTAVLNHQSRTRRSPSPAIPTSGTARSPTRISRSASGPGPLPRWSTAWTLWRQRRRSL